MIIAKIWYSLFVLFHSWCSYVSTCNTIWLPMIELYEVYQFHSRRPTYHLGVWVGILQPGNLQQLLCRSYGTKKSLYKLQRVVWIANRNYPLTTAFGLLSITADGNLMIADRQLSYIVTNAAIRGNTSAVLLDSENLVLNDQNSVTLWQSFLIIILMFPSWNEAWN